MPQITASKPQRLMALAATHRSHPLLGCHCQDDSELFNGSALGSCQLIGTELELDLAECSVELERHLRVVLIDDRRARILSDVETLVEREPKGNGLLETPLSGLFAIDGERSRPTLADAAAVVTEVKSDCVLTWSEFFRAGDPRLTPALVRVLRSVLIRVGVSKHRFAVEHEQTPSAET